MPTGKSSLSDNQIAIVKGLLNRGEMGDRVTWFMSLFKDADINIGRISETKTNFSQHRNPNSRQSRRYQAIAPASVQHIPPLEELRHILSDAVNDILSGKYPTAPNRTLTRDDIALLLTNHFSKQTSTIVRVVTNSNEEKTEDESDLRSRVLALEKRLRDLERHKSKEIESIRKDAERAWKR